jgi:hypothetical protein
LADRRLVALDNYLTSFVMPSRAEIPYILDDSGEPEFSIDLNGVAGVEVNWPMPNGLDASDADMTAFLQSFTRPYLGGRYLIPALSPRSPVRARHPTR